MAQTCTEAALDVIIHGNSKEVLKHFKDSSVDSVVTDPPYGLSKDPDIVEVLTKWLNNAPYDHKHSGFMNKSWDSFVPNPDLWREVYRVLKPGGHALVFAGTRTQDLMTISLRLAGFEIRDVIEWLYFCLSEDTECLTRGGWKRYDELTENDEVMQWNHETNELSWVKPTAIHVFDYHGDMLRFKSRATDQLVTPNHRMYVKIKRHSRNNYSENYEIIQAKDLKGHWGKKFPVAGEYSGTVSIGLNRARLLGWWLTDAWKHGDGKACMFSQSKPETLKKLKTVLDACDVQYSEYVKPSKSNTHNPEHVFYVTGNDAEWLLTEYPDRKLSRSLVELVKEERRALLESLIDGDGSRNEDLLIFWSKDTERLEVVRLLMMSLNMRTSIDIKKGCVRGSLKFNTAELQAKHKIERVKYDGKVWCLTVPTGAFVVSRNSHVFITGNSGFPKSLDVGKAFDKKNGSALAFREEAKRFAAYLKERREAKGLSKSEIDRMLGLNTSYSWWEGRKKGIQPPSKENYLRLKPILDLDDRFDEFIERVEAEREKIGERQKLDTFIREGGYVAGEADATHYDKKVIDITAPATDLAKKWDGWGTALKPAHEPIIVARKPLIGTVAENVERFGTGAINIDGCRIGNEVRENPQAGFIRRGRTDEEVFFGVDQCKPKGTVQTIGRFPANIVTTEPDAFWSKYCDVTAKTGNVTPEHLSKKASKKDRNSDWRGEEILKRNTHPTVKPIELMAWLVRLITPPGGVVLDPFAGSGSTCVAAKREGFHYIGIELEEEYVRIARERTGTLG